MSVASLLHGKEGTYVRLRLLRHAPTKQALYVDVTLERRHFELS